jgi:thiamine biosynthesis lipoprotein
MSKTSTELRRFALSGPAMGSRWTAVLYAPATTDAARLTETLAAAVEAVERQMSTWRAESDLMRLNAAPLGEWVALPADLAHVLEAALRIGKLTDGAFDVGVGAAVASWGFGAQAAERPGAPPGPCALAVDSLDLDARGARARKRAATTLDLSGIAKGFGVDALARALDAQGFDSYLVGIDGELRARGLKPDGAPYAVALERPEIGVRAAMGVVALHEAAVATSGDYRYVREAPDATAGRATRWSHTIDPATGAPVANALAAVTVMARTAMEADAYATALMALGPERGESVARRLGLDALLAIRRAGALETRGVGLFASQNP